MLLFLCVIGTCFHWQQGNWLVTLTFIAFWKDQKTPHTLPLEGRDSVSIGIFIRSAKPLRFLCASLSVNFSRENVHTFY